MDSINVPFMVPGDDYAPECRKCLSLWSVCEKTAADVKRIRHQHYNCHGWTHCSEDCCGPCPYCGWCEGLDEEEWKYNEVTGQMEEADPDYSEAKLKDTTGIDWDLDVNYD